MKQLSELEFNQYIPSKPGYRPDDLRGAINFAACQRDRVPCAWCGQHLNDHGFDTYCRSPHRKDLGLKPY
jgi:hypothetical protein